MTETTYRGLTHTCDDPDCHTSGFVKTLEQAAQRVSPVRPCAGRCRRPSRANPGSDRMNLPDDEAADPFTLAEEERAELMGLWVDICIGGVSGDTLIAHVTELCSVYHSQGYVMGDLAHDGTLKAQAEAPAQAEVEDGWICEVCGCWNRDGDLCKYGDDEAHAAEDQ